METRISSRKWRFKEEERIGRLVLLKKTFKYGHHKAWLCKCDCGTEKVIAEYSLIRATRSCGCYARERTAEGWTAEQKQSFSQLRKEMFAQGISSFDYSTNPRHRKGYKQTEEEKNRRAASNRGKKRTPEQRARISASLRIAMNRPETKQRVSDAAKRAWSNPEIATKQVAAVLKASFQRPTGLEKRVQAVLDICAPNQWLYTGDGKFLIGRKCPDFVHKSLPLVVEAFGRHWHEPEDEKKRIEDLDRDGYKTLVIWEEESDETISKKLADFLVRESDFAKGVR